MLDFQNISIQRKGKKVLDDFSLKAPDGVILALLGRILRIVPGTV